LRARVGAAGWSTVGPLVPEDELDDEDDELDEDLELAGGNAWLALGRAVSRGGNKGAHSLVMRATGWPSMSTPDGSIQNCIRS
jgi:hypothetical protein